MSLVKKKKKKLWVKYTFINQAFKYVREFHHLKEPVLFVELSVVMWVCNPR
jgi:hypothetical protein